MKGKFSFRSPVWAAFLLASGVVIAALVPPFSTAPTDPMWSRENGSTVACSPVPQSPLCGKPYGQWNLRSDKQNAVNPLPHASGLSADLAWQVETGRPDVVAVVLDSGVRYDHEDLRNKMWLNRGELPAPAGCAAPNPADAYDCNNDGQFNIEDYQGDARVTSRKVPLGASLIAMTDIYLTFANGADEDGNGFTDDITGWDADDADGDPYPATRDGHGTGRNGLIAPQTNNAKGLAGLCPNCQLANVRVDDTFVTRSESTGVGVIWAADQGHELVNMALGATSASTFTRAAFDYAYKHNVLALNATANEFSFHQNFATVFDDVMGIGAVVPDNDFPPNPCGEAPDAEQERQCIDGFNAAAPAPTTYLRKANFSNYGAHMDVVTPSDAPTTGGSPSSYGDSSGTSSAVPHAVGVAGLVWSRARNLIASSALSVADKKLKDISNLEVKQILRVTADDIVRADDPGSAEQYPTIGAGWDKYTGYGRLNARKAVDRVGPNTMPPEADIDFPDWYSYVDGTVAVKSYANARWAGSYTWTLQVGAGIQPASLTTLATGTGTSDPNVSSNDLVDNLSTDWDTSALANGLYTLILTVTDNKTPANVSNDRMSVWVRHADAQDYSAAWPKQMGRNSMGRFYPVSLESISVPLVDLDNDNLLEIIFADSDGQVHALRRDGTELAGFPVSNGPRITGLPAGGNGLLCDPAAPSEAFDCNPANGEVPILPHSGIAGAAVADLDGDTRQEICVTGYDGHARCFRTDGTPFLDVQADGFSTFSSTGVETPTQKPEPMLSGALGDLDADGKLEFILAGFDQKLYVFKSDGSKFANFPLLLKDTTCGDYNKTNPDEAISPILVGDIDGDGSLEIVAASSETCGTPAPDANVPGAGGGSGRVFAFKAGADGNWAVMSGWPIAPTGISVCPVPLVACGVGHGIAGADVDGDGDLEMAVGVFLGGPFLYDHTGGDPLLTFNPNAATQGPGGDNNEETAEGGTGRNDDPSMSYVALGAFANINATDAAPEYLTGTIGASVGLLAAGSGKLTPFDHYLAGWGTDGAAAGQMLPNFPRVMDDWQFFTGPVVAEISGDTLPEIIAGSGGYFLYAYNTLGLAAPGWPKRMGQWIVSSPSIGDLDGDGKMEVVSMTRFGTVHVYKTTGAACQPAASLWRKARHDEWNSGVLGLDTLRPNKISPLAAVVSGSTVTLSFKASGDDQNCGTAKTYEVRKLDGHPGNPDWAAATPVKTQVVSKAAGADDSVLTGPFAAGDYTLLLRVLDDAANGSAMASVQATVAGGGGVTAPPSLTGEVLITRMDTKTAASGATVDAGTFRVSNPGVSAQTLRALTFTLSDNRVISRLRLQGPGVDLSVDSPAGRVLFSLAQPLSLAPGAALDFSLSATLATQTAARTIFNSAYASDGGAQPLAPLLAFILLLAAALVRPRTLAALLLGSGLMLAGCSGGGSSDSGSPAPPVDPPVDTSARSSTVDLSAINAQSQSTDVSYAALPLRLAQITRQ